MLMKSGVLRIVVPDIEQCLRAYVASDERFFADRAKTWPRSALCKTRLDHFLSYAGAAQALEDLEGHKYGYDFETLATVLHEARFSQVRGAPSWPAATRCFGSMIGALPLARKPTVATTPYSWKRLDGDVVRRGEPCQTLQNARSGPRPEPEHSS